MSSDPSVGYSVENERRVLIVDDEKDFAVSLEDILESRGYRVEMAHNQKTASDKIQHFNARVALLDVRLGHSDGINLISKLKKARPGIICVIMTAYATTDTAVRALQEGAYDYLRKPLAPEDLLATLDRCFEKIRLEKEKAAAEQALKESQGRLNAIMDSIKTGILVVEEDTLRIADANPAAVDMTGVSKDRLIGSEYNDYFYTKKKRTRPSVDQDQNANHIEGILIPAGRKNIPILKTSNRFMLGGKKHIVESFIDISEQKLLQQRMQQSQKMEAIGTLAGGIAHDFNNILSGILGFSHLAKIYADNPDKAQKNLDQVLVGVQRATDLVKQILAFSKQGEYKKIPVRLYPIVKEAIRFLKSTIPTSVAIEEKIVSGKTIMADPIQIHQVVINLCTNAYHAMRDSGGTLYLSLDDIEISSQSKLGGSAHVPGHYIRLKVKDTGCGIDSSSLEKIFNPYFTTKSPNQGTGLGLAVVSGIVAKHNGFITVESKLNQGSTFDVFFPVAEKEAGRKRPKKKRPGSSGRNENIMLVDDEESIVFTMQRILEIEGYRVSSFKNGFEALTEFKKNPDGFDLVITDMTMPKMTGDELSMGILKLRKDIPIILCSGFNEKFSEDNARKIGIKRFVNKPVFKDDLLILMRDLLDKKDTKPQE